MLLAVPPPITIQLFSSTFSLNPTMEPSIWSFMSFLSPDVYFARSGRSSANPLLRLLTHPHLPDESITMITQKMKIMHTEYRKYKYKTMPQTTGASSGIPKAPFGSTSLPLSLLSPRLVSFKWLLLLSWHDSLEIDKENLHWLGRSEKHQNKFF